jgi:hypothetical protein
MRLEFYGKPCVTVLRRAKIITTNHPRFTEEILAGQLSFVRLVPRGYLIRAYGLQVYGSLTKLLGNPPASFDAYSLIKENPP